VSWREQTPGQYLGVDSTPNISSGGDFSYRLFYRDREGVWEQLASDTVSLQPAWRTHLVSVIPNPFNPLTTVSFSVRQRQPVTVAVYDVSGRLVKRLAHEEFEPGEYTVAWDGNDRNGHAVSTGTYLLRMASRDLVESCKISLIR